MRRIRSMLVLGALAATAPAAQAAGNIDCQLRYSLAGWSVFYKTAEGTGTVSCDNGASFPVKITAKGGGLTVGKTRITNGRGRFTGAYSLNDLVGTYAAAEVHASASKATDAQVMTKGNVSLALAGTGEGWSLGIGFGKFVIERR